jgi:hypothetical protein
MLKVHKSLFQLFESVLLFLMRLLVRWILSYLSATQLFVVVQVTCRGPLIASSRGLLNPFVQVLETLQGLAMPFTPSASSLGPTSPSVTVTLDQLLLAIDKMGLTKSVSAAELYHTILQLQSMPSISPPSPPSPPAILKSGSINAVHLNNQ